MAKLNREQEHSVTYMKNGEKILSKLIWDDKKDGFVLRRISDNQVLVNTAFKTISEFRNAGYMLTVNTRKRELAAA